MALTDLFGTSCQVTAGVLSIDLSELNAKAQAYNDYLGFSGTYVGITSENQLDEEVIAISMIMSFSNYFTGGRLDTEPTANVSCSLTARPGTSPPFDDLAGQAYVANEYTFIQAGIPVSYPGLDPNSSYQ